MILFSFFCFNIRGCKVVLFAEPKLQEKPSALKRDENSVLFSIFSVHFCPPGSGSAICMRIRIQKLKLMRIHADPDTDPKPWFRGSGSVPKCHRSTTLLTTPPNVGR
jgi:hypothetical protein